MNMAYNVYQDQEFDYQDDARSEAPRSGIQKINRQNRRPSYKSRGSSPAAFNGIHRRRNKRCAW